MGLFGVAWWLAAMSVQSAAVYQGSPGDQSTHHLPVENHHSLFKPMDAALHYWSFGGSTVAAQSFLRLTPASQSRTGWLYNDYTLRSDDWELQLALGIKSDFHIGGDGMAIWCLNRTIRDTSRDRKGDPNWMVGGVSGMREDFAGFGVILDTYDNDANRKNPSILVVRSSGDKQEWSHDMDFEPDRVTDGLTDGSDNGKQLPTMCTVEYRNRPQLLMMLRYQKGILHVYTDVESDGSGETKPDYKLCLTVRLDIKTSDTHNIGFTAHTGQIADIHDIESIVMRYLDSDDPELDDWSLARQSAVTSRPWMGVMYWVFTTLSAAYLFYLTVQEYLAFRNNVNGNTALLCLKVNSSRPTSAKLCAGLYVWLVFSGAYRPVFVYTPKFLIHTHEYMTNFKLEPQVLAKLNSRKGGTNLLHYFYIELASSLAGLLYVAYKIFL